MGLVTYPVDKAFFWMVDIVPSKGEDIEEAKEIVRKGPVIWLSKKLMCHIDDSTFEDTDAFAKLFNWRARLFFNQKEKFMKHVAVLQDVHDTSGKQPIELPSAELNELLKKPHKGGWFQTAIVSQHGWNAIVGFLFIACVLLYLGAP